MEVVILNGKGKVLAKYDGSPPDVGETVSIKSSGTEYYGNQAHSDRISGKVTHRKLDINKDMLTATAVLTLSVYGEENV